MNAKVTYELRYEVDPWDEKRRAAGLKCWCLVQVVTFELGVPRSEIVAVFERDSVAETFAGHVFATGLDQKLVDIGFIFRELFELRQRYK